MVNVKVQQLVTFKIANEEYGIPVLDVKEIIFTPEIKDVATKSKEIIGLINIRGDVISVIDFRVLLNKEPAEKQKKQRIIVLFDGKRKVGLLVDEVSHVLSVDHMDFETPPDHSSSYIFGLCKDETRIIFMLDTKVFLNQSEV